jgi:hypothetical protein
MIPQPAKPSLTKPLRGSAEAGGGKPLIALAHRNRLEQTMKSFLGQPIRTRLRVGICARLLRIRSLLLLPFVFCVSSLAGLADSVPVRYVQGTIHGFLEVRAEDGQVVASGDLVQVAHGDEITSRTLFHFKNGSVDDETTVYSQRHQFKLISDHHIQKGPSFPHPMDVMIDCRSGEVTVRSEGKDGKEEVKTDHLDLPADLANGIVPLVLENMTPATQETTVSMLVATPKPRVVKLAVSSRGEERFSVVGSAHEAIHYEIKIELGGVAGVLAPVIGKQPPDIEAWIIGGQAPTFIREQGPLYPEGPIMTIALAGPAWSARSKSGH